MKTQLLCTFSKKKDVHKLIQTIINNYNILHDKIFVLTSSENVNEVICSYNIEIDNNLNFLPNTILVHRKKESNTMYTINALNEMVKEQNNGIADPKFRLEWQKYRNMLVVTNENGLRKIETGIFFIQHIKYK